VRLLAEFVEERATNQWTRVSQASIGLVLVGVVFWILYPKWRQLKMSQQTNT